MRKHEELFELQRVDTSEVELNEKQRIAANKYFFASRKGARQENKQEDCFICHKKCSSFCNSHSIPTFVLSNIAVDGKLYRANIVNGISSPQETFGVNQAGTFHMICKECDSTIFQMYENEKAITSDINSLMLGQIALKNELNEIYIKRISTSMFSELSFFSPMASSLVAPSNMDAIEAEENVKYALRSIQGKAKGYYLFFHVKLNYRVPIAFQHRVVLIADLQGNMVNNVYNFDSDYKQKSLHICVFPLKEASTIMMFVEEGDKRYSRFRKQFKKLSLKEQLEVINYLIFLYSDQMFISPIIKDSIFDNKNLQEISALTSSYKVSTNDSFVETNPILPAVKEFDLSKRRVIPNLLSEEYSLKSLE